jgi:hypothetical protein
VILHLDCGSIFLFQLGWCRAWLYLNQVAHTFDPGDSADYPLRIFPLEPPIDLSFQRDPPLGNCDADLISRDGSIPFERTYDRGRNIRIGPFEAVGSRTSMSLATAATL